MKLFLALSVLAVLLSCNKTDTRSKKLVKGDQWKIEKIEIDQQSYGLKGDWYVENDVSIYDSIPEILWFYHHQSSKFEWQFNNKGKNFTISYKTENCDSCLNASEELNLQTFYLSGEYEIDKMTRKKMNIRSTETNGFKGKEVVINLTRY